MRHGIVYAEKGMFAGWPANHGGWETGPNEFTIGFMRGPYKRSSMHNIALPFEKMQAWSIDGGENWAVGRPHIVTDDNFSGAMPQPLSPLGIPERAYLRFCGVYDTGGEDCDPRGAFYWSLAAHMWTGPYRIEGLERIFAPQNHLICTARTCLLGDLAFLSAAQESIWGTDYTFCARFNDGRFKYIGTVCDDDARAVMPSAAQIDDTMFVALRRRKTGRREGWVDLFMSYDRGKTWSFRSFVGSTGSHNGNPPALIALSDNSLVCVYGNRDEGCMVAARSVDFGGTWRTWTLRERETETVDIGYPRLFLRPDGSLCAVYYWSSREHPHQHIAYTVFEP